MHHDTRVAWTVGWLIRPGVEEYMGHAVRYAVDQVNTSTNKGWYRYEVHGEASLDNMGSGWFCRQSSC